MGVVINTVNNSCHSGGQYLLHSDTNIATVACIMATEGMGKGSTEKKMRNKMISKICRQYIACNKGKPDKDKIMQLAAIESSGQIGSFTIDEVLEFVDNVQSDKKMVLGHLKRSMDRLKSTATWSSLIGNIDLNKEFPTLASKTAVTPSGNDSEFGGHGSQQNSGN